MGCKAKSGTRDERSNGRTRFTLTMWDVKTFSELARHIFNTTFYLNYVGCKGKLNNRRNVCKTLFYLNYVGCKASTSSLKISAKYACFTLTMWDVKRATIFLFPFSSVSFTLTMWDVKQFILNFD